MDSIPGCVECGEFDDDTGCTICLIANAFEPIQEFNIEIARLQKERDEAIKETQEQNGWTYDQLSNHFMKWETRNK